jgi:hypothetical protein
VRADYGNYSPLVRADGLIAFHDIVPGPPDAVGGVPGFWEALDASGSRQEIVEDWHQGGYGIGVLRVGLRTG